MNHRRIDLMTTQPGKSSKMAVAVVVPTLNERGGVTDLIPQIKRVLNEYTTEIVVVDGNSSDGTANLAKDLGAHVIKQDGSGYGDALQLGFKFAHSALKADITVMIDGDMTYDPKDIENMIDIVASGKVDLVVGNRFADMEDGAMSLTSKWGNRLLSWFAKHAIGIRLTDSQCGLRVFRTQFTPTITRASAGMAYATEMIAEITQVGGRLMELPISYSRRVGKSKLRPVRDGLQILSTMLRLARDYRPLFLFGGAGVTLVMSGVVVGLNSFYEWLKFGYVTHPPFVVLSSLMIVSGVQLLSFGLIADMIKSLRRDFRRNIN